MFPETNSQFPNSTPPISPATKSNREFILLLILGFILIAINLCFLYKTYFQKSEPTEQQNLVGDEMANWKTYRNEEYGFEFKYPSTYSAKMFEESTVPGNLLEVRLAGPKKGQYDGPPAYIGISIWNNSKQLSLMDWATENSSFSNYSLGSLNTNLKNEILVGHKAISYSWVGMGDGTTVVIENGQNIILLDTGANNKTDQVWQDFDSILSTFKFISTSTQAIDIADWKIGGRDILGFQLLIPPTAIEDTIPIPGQEPHGEYVVYNSEDGKPDYFRISINSEGFATGLSDDWGGERIIFNNSEIIVNTLNLNGKSLFMYVPDECKDKTKKCFAFYGTSTTGKGSDLLREVLKSFKQL